MAEARVTQAGVYVEQGQALVQVSQAGVYVELDEEPTGEARVTQAGVYVEQGQALVQVSQAGVYIELDEEPTGEARLTQAGVYVEQVVELVQVTQVGVYVELNQPGVRVSQAGVYVEFYQPAGRTTILYDGNDISAFVHSYRLECVIAQWDATDFASSAKEHGSGTPKWRLPVKGHWDPQWDAIMMPDVVVAPTESRPVTVTFYHRVLDAYVSYAFANASMIRMGVGSASGGAVEWDSELVLSGAPTRSVVA